MCDTRCNKQCTAAMPKHRSMYLVALAITLCHKSLDVQASGSQITLTTETAAGSSSGLQTDSAAKCHDTSEAEIYCNSHAHTHSFSLDGYGQLSIQTAKPSSTQPSSVVNAHNETDLAQAISAASGPRSTTILLPTYLLLTKALPAVSGPIKLIGVGSNSLISCSASAAAFTALTIRAATFGMSGLAWSGCVGVLSVSGSSKVTIDDCSFQGNNSLAQWPTLMVRMSAHEYSLYQSPS